MAVRKPYGIRQYNTLDFRHALAQGWTTEIALGFPAFEVALTAESNSVAVPFPVFELGAFSITANGFHIDFPPFAPALTVLAGGVLALDAHLPAFAATFAAQRAGTLQAQFPVLSAAFTLAGGDQTLQLAAPWPLFQFASTIYVPSSASYATWLVNTNTKVHGTYTNYPLLGMGRFNGEWIGLFPDGLYRLEGDDDALTAIATKLYWAPSDLGTIKQKRIDAVYVNCRTEGNLRVIAWTDEQQKRVYTKDCTLYPTGMTRKRQTLTRGLSGQSWQFGIENCDGAKLTVDDIEVVTIPEQRRVK